MDHVLDIQHLTKTYGKKTALVDISFKVKAGSCFGLLGPNGAGKSTIPRWNRANKGFKWNSAGMKTAIFPKPPSSVSMTPISVKAIPSDISAMWTGTKIV